VKRTSFENSDKMLTNTSVIKLKNLEPIKESIKDKFKVHRDLSKESIKDSSKESIKVLSKEPIKEPIKDTIKDPINENPIRNKPSLCYYKRK
jgi:hypothetical protein